MGIFSKLFKRKKKKDEVLDAVKESRSLSTSDKYDKGMKKSRTSFTKKVKAFFSRKRPVNDEYFNDLEETLIMSDVGAEFTSKLIDELKKEARINKITDFDQMNELVIEYLFKDYLSGDKEVKKLEIKEGELNIILVIGVNGVGKTTTIGKLTKRLIDQGYKTHMVAADTFRAGAVQQLEEWARRVNTTITTPEKEGQDPGSVVYKGLEKAKEDSANVVIIDTAGRLQNKKNLMIELEKIYSIIEKVAGKPADETLLVLDATTGQNGVSQAEAFNDVAKLTGIVLTKMDSSSKGGIILSIRRAFNIPVKFIGLGESLDDLQEFDIRSYMEALTSDLVKEESNEQD